MSKDEAVPAATAEQGGSRNLVMRVLAALVLAPLAIAIAYAGGWLWALLVTLASIGLFVEWLMIMGAARDTRVSAAGIAALVLAALYLAVGRTDAALVILAIGIVARGIAARTPHLDGDRLCLCRHRIGCVGAGAIGSDRTALPR